MSSRSHIHPGNILSMAGAFAGAGVGILINPQNPVVTAAAFAAFGSGLVRTLSDQPSTDIESAPADWLALFPLIRRTYPVFKKDITDVENFGGSGMLLDPDLCDVTIHTAWGGQVGHDVAEDGRYMTVLKRVNHTIVQNVCAYGAGAWLAFKWAPGAFTYVSNSNPHAGSWAGVASIVAGALGFGLGFLGGRYASVPIRTMTLGAISPFVGVIDAGRLATRGITRLFHRPVLAPS